MAGDESHNDACQNGTSLVNIKKRTKTWGGKKKRREKVKRKRTSKRNDSCEKK